jgi:broad specificity phosphatase PhoE
VRELFLLRHAESAANERGVLQGRKDYPLSRRGEGQARALAGVLAGLGVEAVFSSPAKRVAATLVPALARGLPAPTVLDDLHEIDLGRAAGLTYGEFYARFGSDIDPEVYRRGEYRFPGGESRRDLFERASVVAGRILAGGWTRALVAAHGGILSQLLAALLGVPFDGRVRWRPDNASLTKLAFSVDRPCLSYFNNREHLTPELRSPPFPPLYPRRG